MAKTVRRKIKGKGLDTIIGDAIAHHLKKMIFGDPKKKAEQAKAAAAAKKAEEKKSQQADIHSKMEKMVAKAVKAHMDAHAASMNPGTKETPKAANDHSNARPANDHVGPANDHSAPTPKASATKSSTIIDTLKPAKAPKPTLRMGADIEVEYPSKRAEKPVQAAPAAEAPKATARPYKDVTSFKTPPKTDKVSGMIIHPKYGPESTFNHSADPHKGKVKYVATLPTGRPLVQPVDEKGNKAGKVFQAHAKNLTEHEA